MVNLNDKNWKEKIKTDVEFAFANKKNHTLHAYIDITGDLVAGTLLSQILYWCGTDMRSHGKLTVYKDGHYWLVKGRDDWWNEVRISPRQYDTAISKLKGEIKGKGNKAKGENADIDETKKFVEVKIFKYKGNTTTHIRPIYENINRAIDQWKSDLAKTMESDKNVPLDKNEEDVIPDSRNCNSQELQNGDSRITNSLSHIYNIYNNINNNTEITNRDYIPETTAINAFESNASKEDIHAFLSGRKEVGEEKIPYIDLDNCTLDDLRKHIQLRVKKFMSKHDEYDDERAGDLSKIIDYFYRKYQAVYGENYTILSDKAFEGIVIKYLYPSLLLNDNAIYGFEEYKKMIDQYFKTDYGQRSGNSTAIDRTLPHFMSDTIRENLAMNTLELSDMGSAWSL